MRTTLTIEDDIAEQIRSLVRQSGKSFKAVVNDALRAGMADNRIAAAAKPYQLKPTDMGEVLGAYHLEKSLELSDSLEDQEIARKFEARK